MCEKNHGKGQPVLPTVLIFDLKLQVQVQVQVVQRREHIACG